jgi:hypothetical protein
MWDKLRNTAAHGPKSRCDHNYKNAIQIGEVDYVCPLCKEFLDPFEWFLMNSFEFVDVASVDALEKRLKRPIVSGHNYLKNEEKQRVLKP